MLTCENISHSFGQSKDRERVLDGVSLSCEPGEACVLLGPSGSGKTTLLCILGCLLTPSTGAVFVNGSRIDHANHRQLTHVRRKQLGFVFQHAQLIPYLTSRENCAVIGRNAGCGPAQLQTRLDALFDRLDVGSLGFKKPEALSGGERQRVAIARALVHRPAVVLADEPTAALDATNGRAAVGLLVEQAKAENAVLITVTHDTRIVSNFDRVLRMDDGRLVEQ